MKRSYPSNTNFEYTADLGNFGELLFNISGDFQAGYAAVQYLPNGDPGFPGEPDTFEFHSAHLVEPHLKDTTPGAERQRAFSEAFLKQFGTPVSTVDWSHLFTEVDISNFLTIACEVNA